MIEGMNQELADVQDTAEEALSRANAAEASAAVAEQLNRWQARAYGKCWGCGGEYNKDAWKFEGRWTIGSSQNLLDEDGIDPDEFEESAQAQGVDTSDARGNGFCYACASERPWVE